MDENDTRSGDGVHTTVEISGPHEQVVGKLSMSDSSSPVPQSLTDDVHRVLKTVARIDGGTRSRVVKSLPNSMSVKYDSESLVRLLQVLELYGLVELDGNTWNPGPRLEGSTLDHD